MRLSCRPSDESACASKLFPTQTATNHSSNGGLLLGRLFAGRRIPLLPGCWRSPPCAWFHVSQPHVAHAVSGVIAVACQTAPTSETDSENALLPTTSKSIHTIPDAGTGIGNKTHTSSPETSVSFQSSGSQPCPPHCLSRVFASLLWRLLQDHVE